LIFPRHFAPAPSSSLSSALSLTCRSHLKVLTRRTFFNLPLLIPVLESSNLPTSDLSTTYRSVRMILIKYIDTYCTFMLFFPVFAALHLRPPACGFVAKVPSRPKSASPLPLLCVFRGLCVQIPCPYALTVTLHNRFPRSRAKTHPFKSAAYALFQVPYPINPLFATLTKTAGCTPTIPILKPSACALINPMPFPTPYPLSFHILAHSLALFCTFLHSSKTQLFCFQALPHSLPKTTRGGGRHSIVDMGEKIGN